MHKIRNAAAALAATGLMTFGAVAASGGIAKADAGVAITACDASGSQIVSVSGVANCTAGTSTILAHDQPAERGRVAGPHLVHAGEP